MPIIATTMATTAATLGVPATPNSSFQPFTPAKVNALAQVATSTQLALQAMPAQSVSHSQKDEAS